MAEEHGRHLHLLDRQRIIDESLAVALLETVAAHLGLRKRHVGRRPLLDDVHLAVDRIAEQTGAVLRITVVDAVVNTGHVDPFLDQDGQGAVERRREEREGEVAGIGHHAHIERFGHLAGDDLRSAELLDDAVEQEAGARRLRIGELQVEASVGRKVMIDQHAPRRRILGQRVAERFEARQGVEIEAEDDIRPANGFERAFGREAEDHHFADVGHPVEKIGVFVGDDHRHLMPHRREHIAPCRRGPDRIAVGVGMCDQHDLTVRCGEQFAERFDFCTVDLHRFKDTNK